MYVCCVCACASVYVEMCVCVHIRLRVTAGAFSYGARSAVLISLHARILWSLQFQREHLYSLPLLYPAPPLCLTHAFTLVGVVLVVGVLVVGRLE